MKKHRLPFLLILMMLISPIASAFDHCASMDMSGDFSISLNMVMSSTDDSSLLYHQEKVNEQQNNHTDLNCQINGNCLSSACGAYSSSAPPVIINIAFYHSNFESNPQYSTTLSADLRPPIDIL